MTYRIRRLKYSDGRPKYQLGRYEMRGPKGKRRSHFHVLVDLGPNPTPEAALENWSAEESRHGHAGHFRTAIRLAHKRSKLWRILWEAGELDNPKPRPRKQDLLVRAFEEMMDAQAGTADSSA